MSRRQLHIPGPDDDNEDVEGDISIVFLSAIFCLGIAFGLFYFFNTVQAGPESAEDGQETAEPLDPDQKLLKEQRALAATFADWTAEKLADHEWTEAEEVAVLRFGPRRAAEDLCGRYSEKLSAGKLGPIRSLELVRAFDRRKEFAPWTCGMRLFFAGELPEGPIRRELSKFWDETRAWQGNARHMMSVLTDFRETRDRPTVPEFYDWVRICALNYDYEGTSECRRLLRQIRPQQGTDILAMAEMHMRAKEPLPDKQAKIIIDALGRIARNGQPPNWKVAETEELPDYDADLRNATVLYLCRFVNSPYREHAVAAAEELRATADAAGRGYDAKLLERWRETCRIGFDGGKTSETPRNIPLVASWNGVEGDPPDYSLELVQSLGHCPTTPNRPIWWCGADLWAGKLDPLDRAIAKFFIETRYMEWPAPDEPLLSPP